MKLNLDCIREILMWLEENQTMERINEKTAEHLGVEPYYTGRPNAIPVGCLIGKVGVFSEADILYSVKQMGENGMLNVSVEFGNIGSVQDITPQGHEFLENIRSDTNWNKIKERAAEVGSSSISVLEKIASNVISALIKSQMGL